MKRAATQNLTWRGGVGRRSATALAAPVLLVAAATTPAHAAAGDWAPGFHGGEPVVQLQPSYVDTPTVASAKSLTYIASDSYPGTPGTTIQRLHASGTPDPAWSGDGVLTLAKVPQIVALHPNADGTLLVGGLDVSGDALVGRLRTGGTWDKTFSGDGKVVLPVDSFQGVRSIAVDSRGRVLAAMSEQRTNIEPKTDFVVARFSAAGRLDTSFGLGGYATVHTRQLDTVRALTVDSHNRPLVIGATDADPDAIGYSPLVVRLTPRGRPDPTFGTKGRAYPSYGNSSGQVAISGHVDRGGRLTVAIGTDGGDYGVVRLTDSGRIDKTFGTNGRTGATCSCNLQAATWSGGTVLAIGSADPTVLRTVKVTAGGAFAASWGVGGESDAALPAGFTLSGTALAPGPNGSVVVGGRGSQDDGGGNLTDALLIGRLAGS